MKVFNVIVILIIAQYVLMVSAVKGEINTQLETIKRRRLLSRRMDVWGWKKGWKKRRKRKRREKAAKRGIVFCKAGEGVSRGKGIKIFTSGYHNLAFD